MAHSILSDHIGPILGAIRSVPIPAKFGQEAPRPIVPFVTISREVGAGAWTLAQQLCETLNAADPAHEQPWTCWDRELVEKVAADHHISQDLIESLEESTHSWVTDFFESLHLVDDPGAASEMAVFHKVALTVRALAQAGRVVLVGRGAVLLTHTIPGGIHVRLDAPLQHRIGHMMKQLNASHEEAARYVRDQTKLRAAFFKRYWPTQVISPDLFAITINAAEVSQETSVRIIAMLVKEVGQTRAPAIPPVAGTSARR